jgi:diguanylate cyclase (GGDEF)-like protein
VERLIRVECLVDVDDRGAAVRIHGTVEETSGLRWVDRAAAMADPARPDRLTGLASWHEFTSRAAGALGRATRDGCSTAVLVVDIDRFHHFNDRFGHETGDLVLVEVARRLAALFGRHLGVEGPGDTVGRLGGDEFVVVCEGVADVAAARCLCRAVAAVFESPVDLDGGSVLVTAGVGVVLAAPGQADVEELITKAESALRRSKKSGRGGQTVFAADMRRDEGDDGGQELHQALVGGELRLYYQPKVALDNDVMVGAEALLRWQHPQRGLVLPGAFIPLAEDTGLIVAIGAWVIEEACREATRWARSYPDRPALVVSVNVSPRQFGAGLVDVVAGALSLAATEPSTLCLEVTESLLMDDVEGAIGILHQLAGLGVLLSMDDFGTGYSSLARLKRFPLNELKIDRSFVEGLGRDADDTAIVAAVIALAHALDLSVVAEGVETGEQLQRLRTLGCEQAQGYYFARPGPPEAIDTMLNAEMGAGRLDQSVLRHPSGTASQPYHPARILVIDDDPSVRQLVVMSLTAVGFEVHQADCGSGAVSTAMLIGAECILLDLAIPGMNGLDVCRALRSDPATANSTIVILTGTDDAADKVNAFSAGADDYITKPFSPRELASRVHAAMRRRREAAQLLDT